MAAPYKRSVRVKTLRMGERYAEPEREKPNTICRAEGTRASCMLKTEYTEEPQKGSQTNLRAAP